jgi:hypothetical protein
MKKPFGYPGLIAVLAFAAVLSSACAKQEPEAVTIQLTNVPAIVTVNQTVRLAANIGNDGSEAGIDWSCGGGSCGAFAPAHTANGVVTSFTAPATPGTVTITVTAAADVSATVSATVTVVPEGSNGRLNGAYVFALQGADNSGGYSAAGTIVADGDGTITGGEQDYSDETLQAGPDLVTGTYAVGPDGRGSITLVVDNAELPNNGIETFSIVLTSAAHALITQFDGTATSSGSLDAQAPEALVAAALDGAFAFTTQGVDVAYNQPIARGGVLIMSPSSGTVTSGTYFENDGGATFYAATAGSVTAPDAFGRGTIALDVNVDFTYYAVEGRVLRLVEKGYPSFMTGGSMYGQGDAGMGATFSEASLTGSYVFSHSGGTSNGPLAMAGQFTSDGAGNFTAGSSDLNNAGTGAFASLEGQGRYTVDANGVGTLDFPPAVDERRNVSAMLIFAVDPALNLFDPSNADGGGGALLFDWDPGAVAVGFIVPQIPGSFEGDYAVNMQFIAAPGEIDWIGRADASAGALAGTIDANQAGRTAAGAAFSGTFDADAGRPGRWTGTFTAGGGSLAIVYYQASASLIVAVDMDGTDVGIGVLEKK